MPDPIVSVSKPVTLVGGADLGPDDLNISLRFAPIIVAADGGADHLPPAGRVPEAIIGDMDSLSDDAREVFGDLLHVVDEQDTTDFEKALTRIEAPFVVAVGFLGGRLDHTMAVLNVMARRSDRAVFVLSGDDVAFMAPDTRLVLSLDVGVRVGLLPLGPVRVSTAGLRWNLQNADLNPAGTVSSSNAAHAQQVVIESEGPLLITLPQAALSAAISAVRAG